MAEQNRYSGPEMRKAAANFGTGQLPRVLVEAYAEVKEAVLRAVQETEKRYSQPVFEMILKACAEMRTGNLDDCFNLPLYQGGAGTSINMAVNEVLSARVAELLQDSAETVTIDPIADINRYQSTNDTFATVVTICVLRALNQTEKKVVALQEVLVAKENQYNRVLITGRTEMQSALPMTLGQVFSGWAGMAERDRWRLSKLKERVRTIALGGTAIGTCFYAPQDVVFLSERQLRQITGLPLSRSQNLPDEIAHHDKLSELASGLALCAENLFKMTGDLLLYTSSMVGEIRHPALQAGSSIMAAKVNPVILEYARGLSLVVQGEAQKIRLFSQNGQLQLNAYLPFILQAFLSAFEALHLALDALLQKFFPLAEIDQNRIEQNLIHSRCLLNALLPLIGYDGVKELDGKLNAEKPGSLAEWVEAVARNTGLDQKMLTEYLDPGRISSFYQRPAK